MLKWATEMHMSTHGITLMPLEASCCLSCMCRSERFCRTKAQFELIAVEPVPQPTPGQSAACCGWTNYIYFPVLAFSRKLIRCPEAFKEISVLLGVPSLCRRNVAQPAIHMQKCACEKQRAIKDMASWLSDTTVHLPVCEEFRKPSMT